MKPRLILVCAIGVATVAHAAEWRFEPVVSFNAQDNSNVFLVDGEPQSDKLASVAVDLAASRRTERATLTLSYAPEREQYQDFSELNNTSHALRVGADWRFTQRSSWNSSFSWVRRERATLSFSDTAQDLVALPRTQYDTLAASLSGTAEQTQRLRWFWGAAINSTRYADETVPTPAGALPLSDSQDIGFRAGLEGDLSATSRLRGEVRVNRIDEYERGERDVRRVSAGWTFGRIERVQVDISAGAAFSKLRDPGELVDVQETSATDTVGSVTLRSGVGTRSVITAGIGRDVTNTLGVAGASLTDSANVGYQLTVGRYSELNVGVRYGDRTPLNDSESLSRTKTKAYRAEYRAAFNAHWALVVAAEKVDQSSPASSSVTSTDTVPAIDYQIFSLGLRWSPLSRGG